MSSDQLQHSSQPEPTPPVAVPDGIVPRVRAYLSTLPDVRLAYVQPPSGETPMPLQGPDRPRLVLAFTRNVTSEHAGKRMVKVRRHVAGLMPDGFDCEDLEKLDYREACEVTFNALPVCGTPDALERERLYRYNVFLEWNAGKKYAGVRQELPPEMRISLDRARATVSITRFVTPIYRHLKMIEGHLRELRRIEATGLPAFTEAGSMEKSLAESYLLKAIQSAILITMSIMHRKMRLTARDYRDLFLLLPVYGLMPRERATRLARCADIRDRLMFQYEEVSAVEVFEFIFEVTEALREFKAYMLEWLFEQFYGPTGELIQAD